MLCFSLVAGLLSASVAGAQGVDLKALEQLKKSTQVPTARKVVKSRVRVTSPKLRDAINLYRGEKTVEAMRLLDELLVDPALSNDERGIAMFFMGKVLFQQQFFYASVPYFQAVMEQYPNAVFYPYSFQRLIWIAKRDGMFSLVVDPLREKRTTLVPRHYKDDIYYMFARTYFEEGNFSRVQQAIRVIQKGSEYYYEGQLMLALMYYKDGKIDDAFNAFTEAAKSGDEDIKGLAQLGVGRILYARSDDKMALQNYNLVDKSSRHWMESQLESAWAHFRANEPSLALGNLHPFDTDAFDVVFSPEASIIKSTVFFRLCKYNEAEKAILTFFEKYVPVYRQIEAFNAKNGNNEAGYRQEVLKAVFRSTNELPPQLTREVFSQAWFHKRLAQLSSLKDEADRLSTSATTTNLQTLKMAKRFVTDSMNQLSGEVLKQAVPLLRAWEKKLSSFFRQASLLRFESAYSTIEFEKRKLRSDFEIPKDQQFEVWEFDEEYWRDELGEYRYLLRSECVEDQG